MGEDVVRKSTNVLKMIWTMNGGSTMTWNLKYPKNNIAKNTVKSFMESLIEDDALLYNNNEADEVKDFYIYQTQTIEIPTA